jgi:hypothetical protein
MSADARRPSEHPARAAEDDCLALSSHPEAQKLFAIQALDLPWGTTKLTIRSTPSPVACNAVQLIGIQQPIGINHAITLREQPWHPNSFVWPGPQGLNVPQLLSGSGGSEPREAGPAAAPPSSGSDVPPKRACYLLDLLLAKADRHTIPGDMVEEFATKLTKYGPTGARLWFWVEALRTIALRYPVCRAVLVSGVARLVGWIFRQIGS